jgi:hypothetical protein
MEASVEQFGKDNDGQSAKITIIKDRTGKGYHVQPSEERTSLNDLHLLIVKSHEVLHNSLETFLTESARQLSDAVDTTHGSVSNSNCKWKANSQEVLKELTTEILMTLARHNDERSRMKSRLDIQLEVVSFLYFGK